MNRISDFKKQGILLLSIACLTLFSFNSHLVAQPYFSILSQWMEWSDPGNMLARSLNEQAFAFLDQRVQKINQLQTADDWRARQEEVRNILREIVGPFPARTPLNARVTGIVEKSGFRVEKVIFESQPGYHVTGALFIPNGLTGKAPAILNPIGHTDVAFRHSHYQQLILNLVHKGFIVFAYDPIGQGERLQYFDPEIGKSSVGGSTTEHTYVGVQCFLTGGCVARYFIWDGIRAVDYLLSRPEVDPERIGVTGLSGGGTQSAYIGAFDERIYAAAPTCYITNFHRLLSSIGPQDAEQNFPSAITRGFDHPDFLEIRAPKPTLLVATTRDFFSIQGARETAQEVKKAFEAFGQGDNFSIADDDYEHGYTKKTREAIYSFFRRAFRMQGDVTDHDYPFLTYEELQVTATGQVLTSLGGETAFSLNKKEAEKVLLKLSDSRNNISTHLNNIIPAAMKISGYREPNSNVSYVSRGRLQHEKYSIEYYALKGEQGMVIPLYLFVPSNRSPMPALIYCHGNGKSADAGSRGPIEWLTEQGYVVAVPDLSGTGETEDGKNSIFNPFRALLMGRSIPGIQAGDIIRTLQFLMNRSDVQKENIGAVAVGDAGPALLHAALFNKSISKVALINSIVSYSSIVLNKRYNYDLAIMIPAILTGYDLPDLAAAFAPKPLLVINGTDQTSFPAPSYWVKNEMEVAQRAYESKGANKNLSIRTESIDLNFEEMCGEWLKK